MLCRLRKHNKAGVREVAVQVCFDNDCHVQVLITFAKEVLSAGLLKNYWPDFLETCWNCVAWAKGKCIKFLEWIHFIFHFC